MSICFPLLVVEILIFSENMTCTMRSFPAIPGTFTGRRAKDRPTTPRTVSLGCELHVLLSYRVF